MFRYSYRIFNGILSRNHLMGRFVNKKYRIVVDQNMPGVEALFGDIAEVLPVEGRSIDRSILRNADALLCRSITQVNQKLLEGTSVKFVGTATIGIDHLDIDWLESQHIAWANAAGCNAAAVAQYVLSAVAYWCQSFSCQIDGLKVGIVGAGNVGTELARCLELLGIQYYLCDPPLKLQGDKRPMVSLDEILVNCAVISLHVPMETDGSYPTHHMIGAAELKQLKPSQLLINASRGAVIDNQSLINYLADNDTASVILDVFESEPLIAQSLLDQCLLTTPHIAGHTLEGKLRGTWLIYKAFSKCFGESILKQEADLYPPANQIELSGDLLIDNLLAVYDIRSDSDALKQDNGEDRALKFDHLRKNATQMSNGIIRRDYSGWNYNGKYCLPF